MYILPFGLHTCMVNNAKKKEKKIDALSRPHLHQFFRILIGSQDCMAATEGRPESLTRS